MSAPARPNPHFDEYDKQRNLLDKALSRLREIKEFRELEEKATKRWGRPPVYNVGTKGSKALKDKIEIDFSDIGYPYPTDEDEVDKLAIQLFQHIKDDDEYFEAYDRFHEKNKTAPLSLERIVVHELMHSAVGTPNALINDHLTVIGQTNDIMSSYFGELPP